MSFSDAASFRALLGRVPVLGWLVLLFAAAVVAEMVVIVRSARQLSRQRRARCHALDGDWRDAADVRVPSRAAEIVACAGPVAALALAAACVHAARTMLVAVPRSSGGPAEKAKLLSDGIEALLNATPEGALAVLVLAILACVAGGLAVSARWRLSGLRAAAVLAPIDPTAAAAAARDPGPSPLAPVVIALVLVGWGLGPTFRGVFQASLESIRAFSRLAAVSPAGKVAVLDEALTRSRDAIHAGFTRSCVGVALALVASGAIVLRSWRTRAGGAHVFVAAALIAAAALGFAGAAPMRRENAVPWPKDDLAERLLVQIETPQVDGPDPLERAPVVLVAGDALFVDMVRAADERAVQDLLSRRKQDYALIHPEGGFAGLVDVLCTPDTPGPRIRGALAAAVAAGFPRGAFAFIRDEVVERPLYGTLRRRVTSAANFRLSASADARDRELLDPGSEDCGKLAARIVAERRRGRGVMLAVGAPPSRGR